MKLKIRIKSFWRHNKKCGGMWATLITLIGLSIPPYGWHTIELILVGYVWLLLWIEQRKSDYYRRSVFVSHHEAWRAARLVLYEVIKKLYESKTKNNETED